FVGATGSNCSVGRKRDRQDRRFWQVDRTNKPTTDLVDVDAMLAANSKLLAISRERDEWQSQFGRNRLSQLHLVRIEKLHFVKRSDGDQILSWRRCKRI